MSYDDYGDFSGLGIHRDDIEDAGFDVLPADVPIGLLVEEMSLETTKSGTGKYIKFKFRVTSPENYEGRVIFQNCNVKNDNKTAERIGMSELAIIMDGCGVEDLKNADQFIGSEFMCYLKINKGSGGYGPSNSVRKILDDEDLEGSYSGDEDEDEKPRKKKKRKAAPEPERKVKKKKRRAAEDDDDWDDDNDDDNDDEEEAPRKKKTAAGKKRKAKPEPEADDEEDDDWDDGDLPF